MKPNKLSRRVDRTKAQSGQPPPARPIQSIPAVRSPSPPGPTIYTPIAAAAELSPPSSCPPFLPLPTHAASLGFYRRRRRDGAAPHLPEASQLRDQVQPDPGRQDPWFALYLFIPARSGRSPWFLDLCCVLGCIDLMGSLDSCRWEACVPVHEEEGERAQVPRHREEDPGGE